MIPHLASEHTQSPLYNTFLKTLKLSGFEGDIASDLASRLTMATDNSVYQVLPQAVVYPKHTQDIQLLFQLAQQPSFEKIQFAPRGGGTGTDGQALNHGIVIEGTRYLHQILEINLNQGFARVQPGVVLDQLNDALQPLGVFFAPNLSPSSRATLGGMFNTDACGKGSCCYGRTSEHVLEAVCVLSNGEILESFPIDLETLSNYQKRPDLIGDIYRQVDAIVKTHREEIAHVFPKLSRFMTGYNLAKIYSPTQDIFNLNYLLGGSEGTLVFVSELKVKLTPLPKHTQLMVIQYGEFDDALRAARALLRVTPTAIETIDDKVLSVAKTDIIYTHVKPMLEAPGLLGSIDSVTYAKAINLVEFSGEDALSISAKVQALSDEMLAQKGQPQAPLSCYITQDPQEMAALWELRKKSVGLLGNLPGHRRPIPFVEDTVVPPEALADYVREFRALLDHHHLQYGMFGHVDAGCLHVRPALDMTDPHDAALIPLLTDAVSQLVKKYGGILWGEHGQGFRSSYAPEYFGKNLYHAVRQIKTLFDPYNRLNPGKIASSLHTPEPIVSVQGPLRGEQDRQIPLSIRERYEPIVKCNGNGQCFQVDPHAVMCPSSKVTRDRVHSPKGRATVMREWLRLLANIPQASRPRTTRNPFKIFWKKRAHLKTQSQDFSQEVYQALSGCLSCKACTTGCPVKVDIPRFKAKFLQDYYQRYPRPLRDYAIGISERLAKWMSKMPRISQFFGNFLLNLSARLIGLVDLPKVLKSHYKIKYLKIDKKLKNLKNLKNIERTVCIVPDFLINFYTPTILKDSIEVLEKWGFQVWVLPFRPNGKTWHVKGFLKKFYQIAQKNILFYESISDLNIPLIGLEPSITLTYRDEYIQSSLEILGRKPNFKILLLQEFLAQHTLSKITPKITSDIMPDLKSTSEQKPYFLLAHCSEKSLYPSAERDWQKVFQQAGLTLEIISVGCCGMAGSFGHEIEHVSLSKDIFNLSWQAKISQNPSLRSRLLVTGFSCACQIKRMTGLSVQHPIEVLNSLGQANIPTLCKTPGTSRTHFGTK